MGLVVLLGGLVWWHGQSLAEQFTQLQEGLAQQFGHVRRQLQQTEWGQEVLDELPFGLGSASAGEAGSQSSNGAGLRYLAGMVAGALWSALGLLGTIGVILVAALYIAAAPRSYVDGLLSLLPTRLRAVTSRVLDHVGHTLWGWLIGQLLDMFVVGVLCGVGLVPCLGSGRSLLLSPGRFDAALLIRPLHPAQLPVRFPALLIALSISGQEALFVGLSLPRGSNLRRQYHSAADPEAHH